MKRRVTTRQASAAPNQPPLPGPRHWPPTDPAAEARAEEAGVFLYADCLQHVCLELSRTERQVEFTTFTPSEGLFTQRLRAEEFDKRYQVIEQYSVAKGVAKFVAFAKSYGATAEVLDVLGPIVSLTSGERDAALAQVRVGKVQMSEEVKTKLREKAAKAKAEKGPKAPRESAAQMYRDLIMAGNFSDEVIFKKVNAKFNKGHETDIAFYRSKLKKAGLNPPERKGGPKKPSPKAKDEAGETPAAE
jgi:hypothetical protein